MNGAKCALSLWSIPDQPERPDCVQDITVGGRKVGLVLMTVNTDIEYKRNILLKRTR